MSKLHFVFPYVSHHDQRHRFVCKLKQVFSCRIYQPVVISVGMVGNMLSFITVIFSSLRYTSTCVYMAAISVLDSAVLVNTLSFLISGYIGQTRFYFRNDWACGFRTFLFYFCIHLDVLLLVAMTIDRFIVVKFPLKAQRLCTPKSALKTMVGLGLFSLTLNFHNLFIYRMKESGDPEDPLRCWYTDREAEFFAMKVYTWIDASVYSFIPFLLLTVLNVLIIRQVRESGRFSGKIIRNPERRNHDMGTFRFETEKSTSGCRDVQFDNQSSRSLEQSGQTRGENLDCSVSSITISAHGNTPSNNHTGKVGIKSSAGTTGNANITVMLLMVSFIFLLLSSPVLIVQLYERYYWLPITDAEMARSRLVHAVVDNLMYTNHAINFLLYCLSGRRFRRELGRLLARCCCLCRIMARRLSHR